MRNTEKLHVDYIGYSAPETEDEVQAEVLGLKLAIKAAEHRIALLKQSVHVCRMGAKSTKTE